MRLPIPKPKGKASALVELVVIVAPTRRHPLDWIIGEAFATYWPPDRIGLL